MSTAQKLPENISPLQSDKPVFFYIDDDPKSLALIQKFLSKSYDVVCFEDPFKCFEVAKENPPYMIMVDLNMPHVDGIETVHLLKNHPRTAGIPIICTSAKVLGDDRGYLNELGMTAFLQKPYDLKTIQEDIEHIASTLVQEIVSEDEKVSVTLCHNGREKSKRLNELVSNLLEKDKKVLLITWKRGKSFSNDKYEKALREEQLFLFEIKSNLLVKLPYMQDLSPLFQDMQVLLGETNLEETTLVFDDFRNLFNPEQKDRTLSSILGLSSLIQTAFKRSHLFMTKYTDPQHQYLLQKIARILTGDEA